MQAGRSNNSDKYVFIILLIGLLLVAGGIYSSVHSRQISDENGRSAAKTGVLRVSAGCQLEQTLVYQRCGHSVIRTVDAPAEWVGLTQSELVPKLDMAWRMTQFEPSKIKMRENIMLFCPSHWIVMPDETGQVCVWTNRYGEGLERVLETEYALGDISEEIRESIRNGRPFNSRGEAEQFVSALKR